MPIPVRANSTRQAKALSREAPASVLSSAVSQGSNEKAGSKSAHNRTRSTLSGNLKGVNAPSTRSISIQSKSNGHHKSAYLSLEAEDSSIAAARPQGLPPQQTGLISTRLKPSSLIDSKGACSLDTTRSGDGEVRKDRRASLRNLAEPTQSRRQPSLTSKAPTTHPSALSKAQALRRPEFLTYQQRYIPKKPTSYASRVISGASDTVSSDSDSSHVLDDRVCQELQELKIMHDLAPSRLQHYQESASLKLRTLFKEVQAEQRTHDAQPHLTAFRSWFYGDEEFSAQERLRKLAMVIQELEYMQSPAGLVTKLLGQYQKWFESVVLILDQRNLEAGATTSGSEVQLIQGLGPKWTHDMSTLQRNLEYCLATLAEFAEPESSSGIGTVPQQHRRLAESLLQSVRTCTSTEKLVLEQEHTLDHPHE